ncbi:MAG: winged helix-turn-helix transcriptional regulator [Dehalococcoidia bacterium]|nr:winged helix-turn-helix transcriptional regulator [Dehalococcoidia bacterium]
MEQVVNVVRALSADTRLRVLKLLRGRDMSSVELQQMLQVPRQTVSYHLSVLQTGGLVRSRKEGRRMVYAAAVPAVADDEGRFERFLSRTLDDVN